MLFRVSTAVNVSTWEMSALGVAIINASAHQGSLGKIVRQVFLF